MNKEILLVGLNYKTAPVEVRERFALTDPAVLARGVAGIDEVVRESLILSTCNRVEIAAVTRGENAAEHLAAGWARACGRTLEDLAPYIYAHRGEAAVRHLFSVAASLDSMVLGEPQILGQLKDAYRAALEKHTAKVILNRLLHKAFSTAKRVRTETAVASSAVSISYAAVELAKRIFDDFSQVRAMLIGAGEMAELAAAHLVNVGIDSIRVTNRTYERAVQLAARFNGEAAPFDLLVEHLAEVDIVISSTGSHEPIIRAADMKKVLKERKHRPMFFIDIAVPRDIDPDVNSLDNIYLYDIDDLKEVVEENLGRRRDEAEKAAIIVGEETEAFARWVKSLELQPTLVDMVRRGESVAREELEKTLGRLGPLTPEARAALEAMLGAVVKKMNHEPIAFLKQHFNGGETDSLYISLARRMFNLDGDAAPVDAHFGRLCPGSKNCPKNRA